jgi:glycosyltransferase involved in cell wall biosynthesis
MIIKHQIITSAGRFFRRSRPETISIMMPNYNHGKYLKRNVEGLWAQSYRQWELNIVDDGSTDDSADIIKHFATQDARIKPIYFPKNQGVLAAAHAAYQACEGDLLYASAADDYVSHPRFFESAVKALCHRNAAGFFGRASVVEPDTLAEKWVMGHAPKAGFVPPQAALKSFLHSGLFIPGVSAIWWRKLVQHCGGYDEKLGPQCDYFVNHALPALKGVVFSEDIVATCRLNPASYSAKATDKEFFERHALVEKKLKELALPYSFDPAWFRAWREHVINGRHASTRQKEFVSLVREKLGSMQPWERSSYPDRFLALTAQLTETCDVLERELEEKVAQARHIFNQQAG